LSTQEDKAKRNIAPSDLFSAWQKTPNFQKIVPAQPQLMRMAFSQTALFLSY